MWARGSPFIVCQLADYRAWRGPQVAAPRSHVTTRLSVQLAARPRDTLKVVALSPRRGARLRGGRRRHGRRWRRRCVCAQGRRRLCIFTPDSSSCPHTHTVRIISSTFTCFSTYLFISFMQTRTCIHTHTYVHIYKNYESAKVLSAGFGEDLSGHPHSDLCEPSAVCGCEGVSQAGQGITKRLDRQTEQVQGNLRTCVLWLW